MPTHMYYRLTITRDDKTVVVTPNDDEENLYQLRDRIKESGYNVSANDIVLAGLFGRHTNSKGITLKTF